MKSSEVYYIDKIDVAANICHNVQDAFKVVNVEESYLTHPFHNLLYHDVFLSKGADKKFQNYKDLESWEDIGLLMRDGY